MPGQLSAVPCLCFAAKFVFVVQGYVVFYSYLMWLYIRVWMMKLISYIALGQKNY